MMYCPNNLFKIAIYGFLISLTFNSCDSKKAETEVENTDTLNVNVDTPQVQKDTLGATENSTIENEKEIYFEGTIVDEIMFDYEHSIEVKILKGKLAGKTEKLVFQGDMNDPLIESCTGNFKCNGDGSVVGKKISGKVVKSKYSYEKLEDGSMITKDCYRPIELNKN